MLQHRQTLQSWLRSDLVTNESVHIQGGFWIQVALWMQRLPQLLLCVAQGWQEAQPGVLADETALEDDVV